MRKLTNVDLLNGLGFKHQVDLDEGIGLIYKFYLEKQD
jgi:nucleoside-diphosphate-sugar epimerase